MLKNCDMSWRCVITNSMLNKLPSEAWSVFTSYLKFFFQENKHTMSCEIALIPKVFVYVLQHWRLYLLTENSGN